MRDTYPSKAGSMIRLLKFKRMPKIARIKVLVPPEQPSRQRPPKLGRYANRSARHSATTTSLTPTAKKPSILRTSLTEHSKGYYYGFSVSHTNG